MSVGLISSKASHLALQMVHLLRFSLCNCLCPNFLFLSGHQPYWIRDQDLVQEQFTFLGTGDYDINIQILGRHSSAHNNIHNIFLPKTRIWIRSQLNTSLQGIQGGGWGGSVAGVRNTLNNTMECSPQNSEFGKLQTSKWPASATDKLQGQKKRERYPQIIRNLRNTWIKCYLCASYGS